MSLYVLIYASCDVNMPDGVMQKIGNNAEVRASFKDWDPRFEKISPSSGDFILIRLQN
jgi:uncharacterized Fe-S cluster-containing radical SAM superfamily protein